MSAVVEVTQGTGRAQKGSISATLVDSCFPLKK